MIEAEEHFYSHLLTAAKEENDRGLLSEIKKSDFQSLFRNPDRTEALLPSLISTVRGYMVSKEHCTHAENILAWQFIEEMIAPYKLQIRSFGVAILYGGVGYDAPGLPPPHKRDIDVSIVTKEECTSDYLDEQIDLPDHSDGLHAQYGLDILSNSMEYWESAVNEEHVSENPSKSLSVYYRTSNMAPLLYGHLLCGEPSMLTAMQDAVLATAREVPIVSAILVSSLIFTKNRIEKRISGQP
jgi:hypothetical protein